MPWTGDTEDRDQKNVMMIGYENGDPLLDEWAISLPLRGDMKAGDGNNAAENDDADLAPDTQPVDSNAAAEEEKYNEDDKEEEEEKDDYELETEFLVPNGYLRDEEDEKEAEEMNELGVRKLPRDDEGHDLDKDTTEEDLKLGRPRLLLSL